LLPFQDADFVAEFGESAAQHFRVAPFVVFGSTSGGYLAKGTPAETIHADLPQPFNIPQGA
jgi:hypothetical protein